MNTNRSHIIFDIPTHTRYLNQRESMKLRDKIADLSCKQHMAVYRNIVGQNNLKLKLHEFCYEARQRDLDKLFVKLSRENSTTSLTSRFNTSEESGNSSMNSPSLLLHDLTESIEFEKSFIQLNMPNKSKILNPYDKFRLQYCSKLQTNDSLQKPVPMSLKQYSERMKIDIKIAVARSARNSHNVARRNERIN